MPHTCDGTRTQSVLAQCVPAVVAHRTAATMAVAWALPLASAGRRSKITQCTHATNGTCTRTHTHVAVHAHLHDPRATRRPQFTQYVHGDTRAHQGCTRRGDVRFNMPRTHWLAPMWPSAAHLRNAGAQVRQAGLVRGDQQVQATWVVIDVERGHEGQEVVAGLGAQGYEGREGG